MVPTAADLLIFDCDGVLVDSEVLVMEVESALLTAAGFPLTVDEIAQRYVGLSYPAMMADLAAIHGRPVPQELSSRVQAAALARFPDHLRPVAGIDRLLAGLRGPRCVASSSDLGRITLSLSVTGLDAYFRPDTIFSAQMVARGKPAPDLFLLAARTLAADPARCVVIEDSPYGVTAAVAAGMTPVGFVGGGHARPELAGRLLAAGAADVVAGADDLGRYLAARSLD